MSSTPLLDQAKKTLARLRCSTEFSFDIDTGEIFLYGSIEASSSKMVLDALREMKGKRVLVRINSPGGAVDSGIAIFNGLSRHSGGCDTVVDSLAASMGSYIFQAGERRMVFSNSRLMLHSPWSNTSGNSVDLRKEAEVLDVYESAMVAAYSKRSKKTVDEIRKLMADETWWTGSEIIASGFADGFADEMLDSSTPLLHSARAARARFMDPAMRTYPSRTFWKAKIALEKAKWDVALR